MNIIEALQKKLPLNKVIDYFNDNDILKCKWQQTALIKLLFKDIYDKLIHVDNIHHFKIVNENWEISFDQDGVISVACKNVNRISFFLGDLFYSKNWDLLELNLKYKKENKVFDSSADGR